ncbi:hypothetical protein L6164_010857 [Bauhinia variegata]|uniref:Uncharacterized protein n=1 Tax=Bauhinia variegata TaxID=167791 RepID=A0ACB9P4U0_BAUVA|nr:hypothetical protein L6164_010857 [Bauhinia variegata]
MASSSHSHQNLKNSSDDNNSNKEGKALKNGQDEEQKDWLELGLGLGIGISGKKVTASHGSNPVSDSPSTTSFLKIPSKHHQIEIGLGLGLEKIPALGLNDNEGLRDVMGMEALPPPRDYDRHSLFGSELDHSNYYHNNNNDCGMELWPSCQMGSQEWHMPTPGDSHHYCTRIRSPHESGLWFTLRPSTNRTGEALPQIPKAYIRVKDENMTIFLVKKYLVTKLGLSDEAEIDISCMGQSLSQMQTLKQVRDTIWLPRLVQSVNTTTMSLGDANHLMSLLYQKRCIFN